MTPHKHAEVIRAYADGAQIQWRQTDEKPWQDIDGPSFSNVYQYRVKPKETIKLYRSVSLLDDDNNTISLWYEETANTANMVFFFEPDTLKFLGAEVLK